MTHRDIFNVLAVVGLIGAGLAGTGLIIMGLVELIKLVLR